MKKLITLIVAAAGAAVYPYSPSFVERHYSTGVYPSLQAALTVTSNVSSVALLDIAVSLLLLAALIAWVVVVRHRGFRAALGRLAVWLIAVLAVVYLLFLATWGLNYRRVPLERKVDFELTRISETAALRLAALSIDRLNAGHAAAHARFFRAGEFANDFRETQGLFAGGRPLTAGRPKTSVLQSYFRRAAINGMTVPVFLEVILNPDLLPVELPATLAHEWAHLAGYADESEANFVAWIACVRSPDPLAQYSGWIESYSLAAGELPRGVRGSLPRLADGPRQDLRAIAERYRRSSPRVRTVARNMNDTYLKANRVEEGIESYAAALKLMLGTRFEQNWKPVVR